MDALMIRRMMMSLATEGEDDMAQKWKLLGTVTVETEANSAYIEIPDGITEVIIVADQIGGDSVAQAISAFAWNVPYNGGAGFAIFSVGNTSTGTSNTRLVCRFRKIELDTGECYCDMISCGASLSSVSFSSSGSNVYSGNRIIKANGNLAGFRKDAAINVLPVGFSFYVLGG